MKFLLVLISIGFSWIAMTQDDQDLVPDIIFSDYGRISWMKADAFYMDEHGDFFFNSGEAFSENEAFAFKHDRRSWDRALKKDKSIKNRECARPIIKHSAHDMDLLDVNTFLGLVHRSKNIITGEIISITPGFIGTISCTVLTISITNQFQSDVRIDDIIHIVYQGTRFIANEVPYCTKDPQYKEFFPAKKMEIAVFNAKKSTSLDNFLFVGSKGMFFSSEALHKPEYLKSDSLLDDMRDVTDVINQAKLINKRRLPENSKERRQK